MVKSTEDWGKLIRALLYPVQFERDPLLGVDRVIVTVIQERAMGCSGDEYLAAIAAALASETSLAELIPQSHSEETVRGYLATVQAHLAKEFPN